MHRLIFFLLFFCVRTVLATETILYVNSENLMNIGSNISIYEDSTNLLNANQVLSLNSFLSSSQEYPNLGVGASSFWIEIQIKNNSNNNNILLELANPMLDEIEFYSINNYEAKLISKYGDILPYFDRDFNHQKFLFNIEIPHGSVKKYLLKIKSWEQISLSLRIGESKKIHEANLIQDLIYGVFFGVIIALIFYNIFIFITVRDKSYLFYVIYILFIALTQATLQGYPFRLFWPNMPNFNNHSLIIFPAIAGMATLEFMKHFLKTKSFTPVLHKGMIFISVIYCIAVTTKFLGMNTLSFNLININSGLISIYALVIAITISIKGYRPAKFFLFSWSIFLIGVISFSLKIEGLLPSNNFTNYTMSIGTAIEVLFLSFALADRINTFRKEKEDAQQKTVEILKENERIVKEQNILLEEKVDERTNELNKTLTNLKETQSQLVDAEKMSSLGLLTAGIAHEINNPINFVSSNINPLRQDLNDLNTLINKYEEVIEEANIPEKSEEINRLKEELDYDYLKTELVTIVDSIENGATRTAEIVSGLRNFSRLDEVDLKKADINEGIESTLTLLKSKLSGIELVKELNPLPIIECFPGKLNQVFMNIITNAIQAVESKNNSGKIIINSSNSNSFVYISIKDNGYGIDQQTQEKIFDPFFTTKDVGEGTGLGLSIVYSIIESHNGTIEVNSVVGEGTEFIIKIPYKE